MASFAGQAGGFRYRTLERVHFTPDGISFEHLDGPFRACREEFRIQPSPDGGSVVTHEGAFAMRLGLVGWLFGVTLVRRRFEDLVAAHMAEMLR